MSRNRCFLELSCFFLCYWQMLAICLAIPHFFQMRTSESSRVLSQGINRAYGDLILWPTRTLRPFCNGINITRQSENDLSIYATHCETHVWHCSDKSFGIWNNSNIVHRPTPFVLMPLSGLQDVTVNWLSCLYGSSLHSCMLAATTVSTFVSTTRGKCTHTFWFFFLSLCFLLLMFPSVTFALIESALISPCY